MLSQTQWVRIGVIAAAALFIIIAIAATNVRDVPRARLAQGALQFQAANALRYTEALSTRYTNRVTGSASSRRAAAYIAQQLQALGYSVAFQHFSLWYGGKRVTGENVIAARTNERPYEPYVAVLAHYDSAQTSPYAAEDDASGVGTMLELARTMRNRVARPVFVATDAEEIGMVGARYLAPYLRSLGEGGAVSIDYVAAGPVRGLEITASGQFGGYTPLWLREIGRAAEAQQAGIVRYPSGFTEWIDRAVDRSFQDQGPLLQAGIAAINLSTIPADRAAAMARYHTPEDVYANFSAGAFAMIGRSAERILLTMDQGRYDKYVDGFLVSPSQYIEAAPLSAIQFIAIVPLLTAMILVSWNLGVRPPEKVSDWGWLWIAGIFDALALVAGMVLIAELLMIPVFLTIGAIKHKFRFAALALPALAAYVLVWQLARHNILLARFELYPAPPKDPSLYQPPALLLLAMLAVLVAGYAIAARKTPLFDKSTLFAWTMVIVLAAFAISPYGMWLYLGVFAYCALLFSERPGRMALGLNLALCALALLPLAGILWFYAREMWLGLYVLWYLVLQAAYGVWSYWIVGTAIVAAVLWMQFVRLALANQPACSPSTLPKRRREAPT